MRWHYAITLTPSSASESMKTLDDFTHGRHDDVFDCYEYDDRPDSFADALRRVASSWESFADACAPDGKPECHTAWIWNSEGWATWFVWAPLPPEMREREASYSYYAEV